MRRDILIERVLVGGEQRAPRAVRKSQAIEAVARRRLQKGKEQSVELLNVLEVIETLLPIGHRGALS